MRCRRSIASTSNIADIAEVWRRGSVIPSWLLDLTASALAENQTLDNYSGFVEDSGEGRWTVNAAIDEAVPAEVLTAALYARFRSRKEHTFAEKILSAMRAGFGGHKEPPKNTRCEGRKHPWRSVRQHGTKPDPVFLRHFRRDRRSRASPGRPCAL